MTVRLDPKDIEELLKAEDKARQLKAMRRVIALFQGFYDDGVAFADAIQRVRVNMDALEFGKE